QVRDIHAPMAAVTLEKLLCLEVLAERCVHYLTADEFLDKVAGRGDRLRMIVQGRGLWTGALAIAGPLPVDARDVPPERRELFLNILHHSPFICLS
ncbi:MAG: hypothetical protein ABSC93_29205, partial [Bryobacteraceae bacterium]